VCDLETSRMGAPYIYDISRLRVNTASGIVTLSKWPSGAQVEKELQKQFLLNLCTGRSLTESDDTRCCINTIWPPEDEQDIARNMQRIVINVLKNLRIELVID